MLKFLLIAAALLSPSLAHAHVGIGDTAGVVQGFMHPLSGFDHILAMVAVGVLAAQIGGRALWAVPSAFVGMMVFGGALGMAGVPVPFVEAAIGVSVVALGLAVAFGLRLPVVAAAALAGFFAIFHGHAHGTEMSGTVSGLGYGLGFVVATALLHVLGIGLGLGIGRAGAVYADRIARVAGGAMTVAGMGMLAGGL